MPVTPQSTLQPSLQAISPVMGQLQGVPAAQRNKDVEHIRVRVVGRTELVVSSQGTGKLGVA